MELVTIRASLDARGMEERPSEVEMKRRTLWRRLSAIIQGEKAPFAKEQETLDSSVAYTDVAEKEVFEKEGTVKKKEERIRWLVAGATAVIVALLGSVVEICITKLASWKFGWTTRLVRRGKKWSAGASFCSFCMACGLLAASCVIWVEPRAKGSGIPEIKTYLNGVSVHRVIAERTLAAKMVGVIFSVAGGLVCGKEGPMVHIGAVVGGVLAQGRSQTFGTTGSKLERWESLKFLSCNIEKRDLVAVGCACGVASAFGSPVGGVLFMIEEAASFWTQRLFFRATFAATLNCVAIVIVLTRFRNYEHGSWTKLKFQGMAVFDEFSDEFDRNSSIGLLGLGACVGLCVGLWGALFVASNKKLTKLRMRFFDSCVNPQRAKFCEAALVALGTALCAYAPAMSMSRWCRKLDSTNPVVDQSYAERYQCGEDEYNELATMTMSTLTHSIACLFHQEAIHAFSPEALAYQFVNASFWACVTYGLSVPSGLFIPSIAGGALFGRLVGVLLLPHIYYNDTMANLGLKAQSLAVAGGIAGLAATTRMTVSIVAIFASTILDGTHLVPILVAALASKLTGDLFNEGLYDVHIHLNHYNYMEHDPPTRLYNSPAAHTSFYKHGDDGKRDDSPRETWGSNIEFFMAHQVNCVKCRAKYADLLDVLRQVPHHGFPVVDDDESYVGLVSREQLAVILLEAGNAATRGLREHSGSWSTLSPVNIGDANMRDYFPQFPRVEDLTALDSVGRDAIVDLMPYINRSALIVSPDTNARFVWRLFRSLGLRHVAVVDHNKRVVGIVTRKDLMDRSEDDVYLPADGGNTSSMAQHGVIGGAHRVSQSTTSSPPNSFDDPTGRTRPGDARSGAALMNGIV